MPPLCRKHKTEMRYTDGTASRYTCDQCAQEREPDDPNTPPTVDDIMYLKPPHMTDEQYRAIFTKPMDSTSARQAVSARNQAAPPAPPPPPKPKPPYAPRPKRVCKPHKKHEISPEARLRMSEAASARHAANRAKKRAKAEAAKPEPEAVDDHIEPSMSDKPDCVAPVIDKPDPGFPSFRDGLLAAGEVAAEDLTGKVDLKPSPVDIMQHMVDQNRADIDRYAFSAPVNLKEILGDLADVATPPQPPPSAQVRVLIGVPSMPHLRVELVIDGCQSKPSEDILRRFLKIVKEAMG